MPENIDIEPIKKAVRIVREMNEDEKEREIARIREKAMHDEINALNGARAEERERLFALMRRNGMSEEDIRRYCAD